MDIPHTELLELLEALDKDDTKTAFTIERETIRKRYKGKKMTFEATLVGMTVTNGIRSYKYIDKSMLNDDVQEEVFKNKRLRYMGKFEDINIVYDKANFSVSLAFSQIKLGDKPLLKTDIRVYIELNDLLG
jgi:hypothetical protein